MKLGLIFLGIGAACAVGFAALGASKSNTSTVDGGTITEESYRGVPYVLMYNAANKQWGYTVTMPNGVTSDKFGYPDAATARAAVHGFIDAPPPPVFPS